MELTEYLTSFLLIVTEDHILLLETGEEFNEKSLIYNDSRGSAVVMHEMLHLFGAPDLYTNTYMSQHYNEDIMVKGAHPCMIGPVTAYAIGWVDCIFKN